MIVVLIFFCEFGQIFSIFHNFSLHFFWYTTPPCHVIPNIQSASKTKIFTTIFHFFSWFFNVHPLFLCWAHCVAPSKVLIFTQLCEFFFVPICSQNFICEMSLQHPVVKQKPVGTQIQVKFDWWFPSWD